MSRILNDVPILFLVFNRPDTTKQVFERISEAKPKRLYVASDGSREGRDGEAQRVAEVRDIATNVDWDCEVITLFRSKNLGCEKAVGGAISWFFQHEEAGIILEDDCVVDLSWFDFASEALQNYRENPEVMSVSALSNLGPNYKPDQDYVFSKYPLCWGWASWRRAWENYDARMHDWPELRKGRWLAEFPHEGFLFESYWREIFDRVYSGQMNSWAYRWTYSCWKVGGYSIIPSENFVENIGFDANATHTGTDVYGFSKLKVGHIKPRISTRNEIAINPEVEKRIGKYQHGISLNNYFRRAISHFF